MIDDGRLALAESLYRHGYSEEAMVEYQRFEIGDSIGLSTMRNELNWRAALSAAAAGNRRAARNLLASDTAMTPGVRTRLALAAAGLATSTGHLDEAEMLLDEAMGKQADTTGRQALLYARGWLELHHHPPRSAAAATLAEAGRADIASAIIAACSSAERRNPALALTLSTLLPGLGEVYAGQPLRGLLTFTTVAVSAVGTVWAAKRNDWVLATTIASLMWYRFHTGAVHNAVRSADEYNISQIRQKLRQLEIPEPDWYCGDSILVRRYGPIVR